MDKLCGPYSYFDLIYLIANYLVIHFNLGISTDWEWRELNVQVKRHMKRDGRGVEECRTFATYA